MGRTSATLLKVLRNASEGHNFSPEHRPEPAIDRIHRRQSFLRPVTAGALEQRLLALPATFPTELPCGIIFPVRPDCESVVSAALRTSYESVSVKGPFHFRGRR